MLYVPFLADFFFIRNKGTINVLQGGGSAEYGQRPYFDLFWDPSLRETHKCCLHPKFGGVKKEEEEEEEEKEEEKKLI